MGTPDGDEEAEESRGRRQKLRWMTCCWFSAIGGRSVEGEAVRLDDDDHRDPQAEKQQTKKGARAQIGERGWGKLA